MKFMSDLKEFANINIKEGQTLPFFIDGEEKGNCIIKKGGDDIFEIEVFGLEAVMEMNNRMYNLNHKKKEISIGYANEKI